MIGNSGLAIPINQIKPILNQLKSGKGVERPQLGLVISQQGGSVVVDSVIGAAEKAGVKPGDIVLKVDGKVVTSARDLTSYIQTRSVGQTVTLLIKRDGKEMTIPVTLTKMPENVQIPSKAPKKVYVMGQVEHPGMFTWRSDLTVSKAVEAAGGLTKNANVEGAVLIRTGPTDDQKTKLDIAEALKSGSSEKQVKMQPSDIIYVPAK
jgi:protein involved in polysaccharide export with SLBB domain